MGRNKPPDAAPLLPEIQLRAFRQLSPVNGHGLRFKYRQTPSLTWRAVYKDAETVPQIAPPAPNRGGGLDNGASEGNAGLLR